MLLGARPSLNSAIGTSHLPGSSGERLPNRSYDTIGIDNGFPTPPTLIFVMIQFWMCVCVCGCVSITTQKDT